MLKNRILIYSDCNQWGGHELMTAEMANSLANDFELYFCYFNSKYEDYLNRNIIKINIPVRSRLSYCGLGSFDFKDVRFLVRLFKEISPVCVIVSQGVIELGLKALWAAKLTRFKTVSYIPLCFPFSLMNNPFSGIRDFFGNIYFKLFDAFITISNEQRYYLKQVTSNKEIYVLENPISLSKENYKALLKVPPDIPKVGIIGRISFSHKGQDRAVEVACQVRRGGKKIVFVIVGDGKDKSKLGALIQNNNLKDSFFIKQWTENKKQIYKNLDCVLITSHFEGVPLVLLESIAFNKLTFAPSQGVYSDYLPKDYLYSNLAELSDKLMCFNHYWGLWRKQRRIIFDKMYRKNGTKSYRKNLLSIMESLDVG